MKCAVMKKMNGIVDPISLGFILTAMIAGAGVTTASNIIEESNITKVKIESEKNVMVKNEKNISSKELFSKIINDDSFDKEHYWRFNQNRLNQLLIKAQISSS
jgi:hypothetical protein